ncbi:MAG: cohesin domain-containing protein [Candidatus Poribacteria bacterium]|nr:cohesin domain-containing protein [Candidatus Poribacteria bacterium]MDP6750139.1 cohesin domain-containing protein [Candidatus Poribacteria bacterium]
MEDYRSLRAAMTYMMRGRVILWLWSVSLLMLGCGLEDDGVYVSPRLELKLAPGLASQFQSVNRLVVSIEGVEMESKIESVPIQTDQRRFSIELILPLDATTIRVEAYEADENGDDYVSFTGHAPITGLDRPNPKITVQLHPTTSALSLAVSKAQLPVGQPFTVQLQINVVENLSAISLELAFDEQLVRPTAISAGSIFDDNPLLFHDLDLDREPNRVGMAVGLREGKVVEAEQGTLLEVTFEAIAAGKAKIWILPQTQSRALALTQPDGSRIDGFQRLAEYVTRASASIRIVPKK